MIWDFSHPAKTNHATNVNSFTAGVYYFMSMLTCLHFVVMYDTLGHHFPFSCVCVCVCVLYSILLRDSTTHNIRHNQLYLSLPLSLFFSNFSFAFAYLIFHDSFGKKAMMTVAILALWLWLQVYIFFFIVFSSTNDENL